MSQNNMLKDVDFNQRQARNFYWSHNEISEDQRCVTTHQKLIEFGILFGD